MAQRYSGAEAVSTMETAVDPKWLEGIPCTLIDGLLFVEGLGWRRSLPPGHFAGNTASLLLPSFRKLGNVPSVPEFCAKPRKNKTVPKRHRSATSVLCVFICSSSR